MWEGGWEADPVTAECVGQGWDRVRQVRHYLGHISGHALKINHILIQHLNNQNTEVYDE